MGSVNGDSKATHSLRAPGSATTCDGGGEATESAGPDGIPEGFTLALALVDALPVAFFCAAAILAGVEIGSPLFTVGAALAAVGGTGKVCWKLVLALARRNVPLLGRQMRVTMPTGFLLMIAGAFCSPASAGALVQRIGTFPSAAFAIAWVACMGAMGYLATHRDQADARSNWVEQLVNAAGQACLLVAIALAA